MKLKKGDLCQILGCTCKSNHTIEIGTFKRIDSKKNYVVFLNIGICHASKVKKIGKLPHPKNCVYDLFTGLCDYCGKPDMSPKLKQTFHATLKEAQCFCKSYYDEDNQLRDCTCGKCKVRKLKEKVRKSKREKFFEEVHKMKKIANLYPVPTKSKEPRCTMTTSKNHIWTDLDYIDPLTPVLKCQACGMYKY